MYEPGQFTLISMGHIKYSRGLISGPHVPIPTNFWTVDVFHHAPPIHDIQNAEKRFDFVVCLFVCLFACLFVCLLVCLFVCVLGRHHFFCAF